VGGKLHAVADMVKQVEGVDASKIAAVRERKIPRNLFI
jgi:hypothetical protein